MMHEIALRQLHSTHSALRESIIEHRFIADVLCALWRRGIVDAEVLRAEFDAGGYDLVLSCGDLVRHIQLKAGLADGKKRDVPINLNLVRKASGCVVWIDVSPELEFKAFWWFGCQQGGALPDTSTLAIGKHTKGDSKGVKAERPNIRRLARANMTRMASFDELLATLLPT